MLENHYVLRPESLQTLKRFIAASCRSIRTVQVQLTDRLEKERSSVGCHTTSRTLQTLLNRNRHDWKVAMSKSTPPRRRGRAFFLGAGGGGAFFRTSSSRAVRLIEELGLRNQRIGNPDRDAGEILSTSR